MLRIIFRILQLQFLLLCLFLICYSITGSKNTVFWFALVSLSIMTLSIIGEISQRSKEKRT